MKRYLFVLAPALLAIAPSFANDAPVNSGGVKRESARTSPSSTTRCPK
jgi:hypothetical protein